MKGSHLALGRTWQVGDRIGAGGFGQVFAVTSGDEEAVAKFVPKAPGADRELLFVSLSGIRNVVPVIDAGEHGDSWVLVMPHADLSLRDFLDQTGPTLAIEECVAILSDITDALTDLDGRVVHRDLKPENVLRLDGRWCLADFGISRYAEASTAPDTRKFALSPQYAAPERWRNEHATNAADMYALGVIGYEVLTGRRPFTDGSIEDLREAHLHADPPPLEGVPTVLATLIEECLYKAPQTRPSPANFRARLDRHQAKIERSAGLTQLQEANHAEVQRRAEAARHASQARTESERRADLVASATRGLSRISAQMSADITSSAPSVNLSTSRTGGWTLRLNAATLTFSAASEGQGTSWGGWTAPPFDVVSVASVNLKVPADRNGYEGRSHSLWFGDIQEPGQYGWYETAFMISPMIARQGRQDPFALDPGEEAAKAVWPGIAEFQVAWPFTRLEPDDLEEFISRWAGWLASAANGGLGRPSTLPERPPGGSWRRS
jgi:eukaryotic-like serine/threonine-protein kinase